MTAVSRFLEARGTVLHVREDRNGSGPVWAWVNSLGSDLRIWDSVIQRLPGRHLRHDLRGHGLSSAPPGPYSIAGLAADLEAVLEHAAAEEVILAGISIGGLISLRAALDAPQRLRALAVLDSGARIGSHEFWNDRIGKIRAGGLSSVAGGVSRRWFSPAYPEREPAAFEGYTNMLRRTPLEGYLGACAALRDEDLTPRLPEVQLPTLVLCGTEDGATPPELSRALADGLPRAEYREIPAAGHLPPLEQPDETSRLLKEFSNDIG